MPGVLEDEEDGNLVNHCYDRREWHCCGKAAELCQGMEEPDLWKFDSKVGEKHETGATPLLDEGGDLLL